jgi:hypothetical protein
LNFSKWLAEQIQRDDAAGHALSAAFRQTSLQALSQNAFPSRKDEEWRYTPLQEVLQRIPGSGGDSRIDRQQLEAAKAAARIKKMELELAESALGKNSDLTKLDTLVDEIARAKAELTKAHLRCIAKVKKILSEEQYRHLLELAKAKK